MAVVTAYNVAADALREIGAYSPYDTAPDPSELAIALRKLQLFINEKVGTEKLWFFVPVTEAVSLTTSEDEYVLNDLLDTDLQFIYSIYCVRTDDDGTERRSPVAIIGRDEYEQMKAETPDIADGIVEYAYIERDTAPNMYLIPAPSSSVTGLEIQGQKYPSAVLATNGGQIDTGFSAAWERYLILQTAKDCGRGAVTKIDSSSMAELDKEFMTSEHYLLARNNKEHAKHNHVKTWEF